MILLVKHLPCHPGVSVHTFSTGAGVGKVALLPPPHAQQASEAIIPLKALLGSEP